MWGWETTTNIQTRNGVYSLNLSTLLIYWKQKSKRKFKKGLPKL